MIEVCLKKQNKLRKKNIGKQNKTCYWHYNALHFCFEYQLIFQYSIEYLLVYKKFKKINSIFYRKNKKKKKKKKTLKIFIWSGTNANTIIIVIVYGCVCLLSFFFLEYIDSCTK